MLTVALSRTQVQLWYNRFKKGQEDDARVRQQSKKMILDNR